MDEPSFFISEAAKRIGRHRQTLINYEKRGIIQPKRDINGFRRYTEKDLEKLKKIFSARWSDKRSESINDTSTG